MRLTATHAETAFTPLDHIKNQAPTPTPSQSAAPHIQLSGFGRLLTYLHRYGD